MPSGGEEYSGPVVLSAVKNPFCKGLSPTVTLHMDHAHGKQPFSVDTTPTPSKLAVYP